MSLVKTAIDTTNPVRPDGIDAKDITGNGLLDLLVNEESGKMYWYEQTTQGNFTYHQIEPNNFGTKTEGAVWWFFNGQWHAVALDQEGGRIAVYEPDITGVYTGTWTSGVIKTGVGFVQNGRAFDLDGDGVDELVFAYEGGGIQRLKYNSGNVRSASSYSSTQIANVTGAWWITKETRDLGGQHGAKDFAFTARSRSYGNSAGAGVYIAKAPTNIDGLWDITRIDSTNFDWLHCDFGNFYGQGTNDLYAHSFYTGPVSLTTGGDLYTYNSEDNWSRDTVVLGFEAVIYGAGVITQNRNGRYKFLINGVTSGGSQSGRMSVYYWTGSAWAEEAFINDSAQFTEKMDDDTWTMDLSGDGIVSIVTLDTNTQGQGLWEFSFPEGVYDESGTPVFKLTGGRFIQITTN